RKLEVAAEKPGRFEAPPITLGDGAAVGGRVVRNGEPVAGREVELHLEKDTIASAETDASGRFSIRGVAPGSYSLVVVSDEDPELAIVVASGATEVDAGELRLKTKTVEPTAIAGR